MAGDWIKFEVATSDKPEVWEIATALNIDPDAVVGKLLRVWSWFDQQTEKGNAKTVTKMLLDRTVGVTGFCNAVIAAGWMQEANGQISLTEFEKHNGQTAKNRALTARRVAKSKAKGNAGGNDEVTQPSLPKEDIDIDKDIDKKNKPSPAARFSEEDESLANQIFVKIKSVSAKSPTPDFKKWADQIRLMREVDGHTHQEISEVFIWANMDDFWKTNILSIAKLREQFPQLSAKKEAQKNGQRNKYSRPTTIDKAQAAADYAFGPDPRADTFLEGSFDRIDPNEFVN